jgi:hypothetical protein
MSEHEDILSMVIAAATQIGVVEQRGGAAVLDGGALGLAGEKGGDALAVVEWAKFPKDAACNVSHVLPNCIFWEAEAITKTPYPPVFAW